MSPIKSPSFSVIFGRCMELCSNSTVTLPLTKMISLSASSEKLTIFSPGT